MMEVTQKVELKELPTEDEIMRSIAAELDEEVDKLNTPDVASTVCSRKSTVDEELQNGLEADDLDDEIEATPPSDSIAKDSADQSVDKDLEKERDAGSDLDALLDKISSIVDCDQKEPVEEEEKADEESETNEEVADKNIDNNEKCKPVVDDLETKVIDVDDEEEEEEISNNNVEAEVLQEEDETLEEKDNNNIDAEPDNSIEADEEEVESEEKDKEDKLAGKPEDKTADSKGTKIGLTTSSAEVFEDALETISSSDEFDGISEANTLKPDEPSPTKETNNGLEDITSDDSIDKRDLEMPKTDPAIIDLDSADESSKEEASDDAPIKEKSKDAKKKHILKEDPMEVDEEAEEKVENAEEQGKAKEVEDVKLTATEELRDVDIDDMLMEATDTCDPNAKEAKSGTESEDVKPKVRKDSKSKERRDSKPKESKDPAKTDEEDLPATETNGTEEKETDQTSTEVSESKTKTEKLEPESKEAKEDDSDDEVIIFEPTEESTKVGKAKKEADKEVSEKKDDEVVLVSEDEDEEPPTKKPVEEDRNKKSEVEATTKTDDKSESNMLIDNSDNACDQFEKQKTPEKPTEKVSPSEDSNSSNLLQPTQKSRDETAAEAEAEPEAETEVEAEAEAETEAGANADHDDVEMVTDEPEDDTEESSLPPVKRIRLSTDDKLETSDSSSCTANSNHTANTTTTSTSTTTNTSNEDEAQPAVVKRGHCQLINEEKEDIPNKKLKTDGDSDSNSSCDGNLQIDLDAHEQNEEAETSVETIKPKEQPIELKPAPELQTDVKPLRLDFVKSFRKSFDKMSRCDLEELVLQKVVEGMLVKSEFADLRRQVDKQEVTLSNYRRKIAEVSKQFLDLETVHNRVLKDLETRNSHFTAPVRITRAVGLQVGMTLMKKPNDDMRNQAASHTAGSMPAPATADAASSAASTSVSPVQQPPRINTSPKQPHRSPLRGMTRAGPVMQHPQQQQQQQQHQRFSATSPARRGCHQKVTPQRPVNNSPQTQTQTSSGPSGMQRPPSTLAVSSRLYVAKHTGNTSPAATAAAAAAANAATMRSRGIAAKPAGMTAKQLQQQQQQQQQQLLQQQQQTQQQQQSSPSPVRLGRKPNQANNKARQMPMGGGTVSVPMSNAQADSASSGYGQPSLAPARPKEKAVIDLTDEDDAAAVAAAEAAARLRQSPIVGIKRSASSGAGPARPVAGSMVRVSSMSIPRNAVARQLVNNKGTGQRNSVGANVTMQIRSENTPPSPSRLRYSHPAPLPVAPAQTFHPNWKLPPSRPVIRISLHDSGIVISWTLEDTGSRFAECVTYQIYAYQETINEPSTDSWRHVGDVKAMLLPMAVTLNQFQENQRYFFAVRGVDVHDRYGVFSVPKTW